MDIFWWRGGALRAKSPYLCGVIIVFELWTKQTPFKSRSTLVILEVSSANNEKIFAGSIGIWCYWLNINDLQSIISRTYLIPMPLIVNTITISCIYTYYYFISLYYSDYLRKTIYFMLYRYQCCKKYFLKVFK